MEKAIALPVQREKILEEPASPDLTGALGDDALLEAVGRHRDERAFEQFSRRYSAAGLNAARKITGDRESAEVAVQEAMLSVWRGAPAYRPGNARKWFFCILVRESFRVAKEKRQHRKRMDLSHVTDLLPQEAPPGGALERDELMEALRRALEGLPLFDRQLVVLHFAGGMSQQELAAELDRSQGFISTRLKRVAEDLRARLSQAGFAAALPLVSPKGLCEAILGGAESAPNLYPKILRRIAEHKAHSARPLTRASLRAGVKSGSALAWALSALGTVILCAGAAWLIRPSASAPRRTERALSAAEPASAATLFSRSWDFNSPQNAHGIQLTHGSWHHLPGGGPDGSGCMESEDEQIVAVLDIQQDRLPLLVSCRYAGFTVGVRWQCAWWSSYRSWAMFHDLNAKTPGSVGVWYQTRGYVTREFTDLWVDRVPSGWVVHELPPGARLALYCSGKTRLDDLCVRQLLPGEIRDGSRYLAALEHIEPSRRRGRIVLPDLKFPGENGTTVVEFVDTTGRLGR